MTQLGYLTVRTPWRRKRLSRRDSWIFIGLLSFAAWWAIGWVLFA